MPSVLLQAGAALLVFWIARRLYGSRAALAAAALYGLTPAVQLSALVVATDAPLLFFIGLTLLAYVALQEAQGRRRLGLAAGVGVALGLAFLSKYAACLCADRRRASPGGLADGAARLVLANRGPGGWRGLRRDQR